jgi:hypothetical protein
MIELTRLSRLVDLQQQFAMHNRLDVAEPEHQMSSKLPSANEPR